MSESRRSTRARAREEAAPAAQETRTQIDTPGKSAKVPLKRKRTSIVVKDSTLAASTTEDVSLFSSLPAKQTLPLRLLEGQPLPTLFEPQPLDLSSREWHNIQQSGVLEASLDRSRAVWTSGINFRTFHKHFTQPKKVSERTDKDKANNQRQKEIIRNFPQIGGERENVVAQLVIEPHTFPIRLYGPREAMKTAPKKVATSHYGPWPNHNQHGQPNQYTQYNNANPTYQKPQPHPRPPPPKPVQARSSTTPTSSPAPDPVIHMLAARAGTDPELKAVMKIVAAGTASREQLEFFQSHINDLTAIVARQKEQTAHTSKPTPAPSVPKSLPPPASKLVPIPPTPKAVDTVSSPSPAQTGKQPLQTNAPDSHKLAAPHRHTQQFLPVHQPHASYPNHHHHHPIYRQPQRPPLYAVPQRTSYRPLIFEFVEGNNDKLYFPSYSFLEWLPNGSGIKLSFLITKMKPRPRPKPVLAVEPPPASAPEIAELPPPMDGAASGAVPGVPQQNSLTSVSDSIAPITTAPAVTALPAPAPYMPPPRIEDFDEREDIGDIDFYQPVTVLILSTHPDVVHSLPRAVRPPDVVERYMNEVFDRCQRADETYLAFRLPRDGDAETMEKKGKYEDIAPDPTTPIQDIVVNPVKRGAGRPRKSLAG